MEMSTQDYCMICLGRLKIKDLNLEDQI